MFRFVCTLTINKDLEFIHVILVLAVIFVNQALSSFSLFLFICISMSHPNCSFPHKMWMNVLRYQMSVVQTQYATTLLGVTIAPA